MKKHYIAFKDDVTDISQQLESWCEVYRDLARWLLQLGCFMIGNLFKISFFKLAHFKLGHYRNETRFHFSKKASAKTMKASAEFLQTLVDVFTVSDAEMSADFKLHQKQLPNLTVANSNKFKRAHINNLLQTLMDQTDPVTNRTFWKQSQVRRITGLRKLI
ncbi:hypothetical protein YC2023_031861 [Brassica napus]